VIKLPIIKTESRKIHRTTPQDILQRKENYVLRLVGAMGAWGQMLFNLIFIVLLLAIASKPNSVAVLKPDGEVAPLTYMTTLDRPPELVKLFARKSTINLYSWLNTNDDTEVSMRVKPKSGETNTSNSISLPASVSRYVQVFAPSVRTEYTTQLVNMMSILKSGKGIETIYRVRSISNPSKKADLNISVDVIGDIEVYRQSQIVERKKWNRRLTLQPIPPTDPSSVVNGQTQPNSIGNDVSIATGLGLQILSIEEI
jgi:hypothetical protein